MATIGKRVVDDLYIHLSAVNQLESADHRALIQAALQRVPADHAAAPNLAKLNLRTGRLSLLAYPDFEEAPFSALSASWAFSDDPAAPPGFRSYDGTLNPPILHRKELMVAPGHSGREAWLQLTASAEALGLFDDTTTIGFALNWQRLVQRKGYRLVDGALLPLGNQTADETRRPTSGLDLTFAHAGHAHSVWPSLRQFREAVSRDMQVVCESPEHRNAQTLVGA